MSLDHSSFIARHHKVTDAQDNNFKPQQINYWLMALLIVAYLAFTLVIMKIIEVEQSDILILFFLLLGGIVGGYGLSLMISMFSPLLKERNLLREIMESSNGARMISDSHNRTVLCNQAFTDLVQNFGPAQFSSLYKLFASHGEILTTFLQVAEQAQRGAADQFEANLTIENKDIHVKISAEPVAGWAGYIYWRIDDITAQQERARQVRDEREKLIDFTDNAPVGFFSVNEDGRFVFINATLARWLGQDIETILNKGRLHHYFLEPPENCAPYDIKQEGGARQVAEVTLKGQAGRTFQATINQAVVHEENGLVRTRAVVNDLTSERAMRTALQLSEDRFRKFFEEAPVAILVLDKDFIIKDNNALMLSLLQKNKDTIKGQRFIEFVDKEDWTLIRSYLETLLNTDSGNLDAIEVRLFIKSLAQTISTRMYARLVKDSDDIALHFIDLTQQKSLETQFIQSQKMQAVGQLAGGIAHDFNNLLTAIIGFCDLLLLRHKPGDPSFGDIQQIKQNSNRAANLVRQLLAFSRQQTLRPKTQDITDIITELSQLLRRLIGANIDLKIIHGQDLGYVKVDGGQMEQVLVNMAVNARDAMTEGGTLKIALSRFTPTDVTPCVGENMPAGDYVRIDVSDTGCGIAPENLMRIFEPFYTTKDVGQGTGLGLATVFGIIRQTGGYVRVTSELNVGTTFSIFLHRLQELEAEEKSSVTNPEEGTSDLTGTARILLVEDEDAVRMFSSRALTNKGYEVLSAENGEAGWELFEREQGKIDLLITDVIMPGIDGPTLAKKIRDSAPTLKIIFVSGYTEEKLKDYMGDGIYFLPKPFTLKQLASKVKDVLDEK
jgi:two-component system, cell cycle sensor histidine kinase and response regulator CckA